MASKADELRSRAESKFRKQEQRSREAQQIHAENTAKARAVDEKTTRLKALRLAKATADEDAAKREQAARPSGGHARRGTKNAKPPPLVAKPDEVKGG